MTAPRDDLILLFGSGCSACSGIAGRVAEAAAGRLQTRPLNDREVTEWLSQASIEVPSRPSLLVRSATGVQLLHGVRMTSTLLRRLGPTRALAVLRAVGAEDTTSHTAGPARRSLLKSVAGGIGIVATSVILAPAATAAATEDVELTAAQIEAILRRASSYDRAATVNPELAQRGFKTEPYEEVVIGLSETDAAVLAIYALANGDGEQAAVVALRVNGEQITASLEVYQHQQVQSSRGVDEPAIAGQFTAVPLVEDFEVAPMGVREYVSCMFSCVGANCAAQASRCRSIPYAPGVLLCMATICGSKANTCHRVCRGRL